MFHVHDRSLPLTRNDFHGDELEVQLEDVYSEHIGYLPPNVKRIRFFNTHTTILPDEIPASIEEIIVDQGCILEGTENIPLTITSLHIEKTSFDSFGIFPNGLKSLVVFVYPEDIEDNDMFSFGFGPHTIPPGCSFEFKVRPYGILNWHDIRPYRHGEDQDEYIQVNEPLFGFIDPDAA